MEFVCEVCKKSYTSDGSSKPLYYRQDGSISKFYKTSRFCSRECAIASRVKNFRKAISQPEFHEKQSERVKTIWKNRIQEEIKIIHSKIQKTRDVDKFRRSFQKTIQNRTEEVKRKIHEHCSRAQKYSKERRLEINNKIRNTKLSDTEKFNKSIQKMKETKANRSKEKLQEIKRKRRETWNAKPVEEKLRIKQKEINTKKNWSKEFRDNFTKRISNSLKEFHLKYPEKIEEMKFRNKRVFNSNQELIAHIVKQGTETKLKHFKTALKISIDDFKSQFNGDLKSYLMYLEDLYQKMLDKKILVSGHSPDELRFYIDLLRFFNPEDIEFPFKLDKYEYDFLIKPLNTVVELNIFPSHGSKEFDENNVEDINERERLKANYSSLNYIEKLKLRIWANWDQKRNEDYKGASDINKKKLVLDNGLTYKSLYNKKEIDEFLSYLKSYLLNNPASDCAQ